MKDILELIEKVFNENKLIGNYEFSELEYSIMIENVRKSSFNNIEKQSYKLIFATLVEIAKRWRQSNSIEEEEENSGYWDYVFYVIFGLSFADQQICHKYRDVISSLGKSKNIVTVNSGQKFYATIMMHAFAPKSSIYSFFDLCYHVFKKDLDYGFTSDDEWYCYNVALSMKRVLEGGYREDKLVSIGSSAYSIKIGLRSFVLNEKLSSEFDDFIKETFYNINKLFYREVVDENTRLEKYIVNWWKNKTESEKLVDGNINKKRVPTVSKQDINAKYLKIDNDVFLCIPSIRLDDNNSIMILSIYVDENLHYSDKMIIKHGELLNTTKPLEFKLNTLLNSVENIKVRVEIKENDTIVFNSEKNKTTSLNREFILFDNEKEIFSQINKQNNYFIYSKDIDMLKIVPDELNAYGKNLYNIYPKAGESIIGETKQIFFVDKTKTSILGKNPCLIGSVADVEWILEDFFCVVYKNAVKLMVPENINLKALELIIDDKRYKLNELIYERIELNCYQFGLKILGLLSDCYPTKISLYSYEEEKIVLEEMVIVLPNLDIEFNYPFYYGDLERTVTIKDDVDLKQLSWSIQDDEVITHFKDGLLVIKVPYLRWRINNEEWRKEPINKKIWYKNFLQNGDLLEIDNPKENEITTISIQAGENNFKIPKNQKGKYDIGRTIYANENNKDILVSFLDGEEKFDLFNVATKEHFIDNPLIYTNGKSYWDVENKFYGEKDNEFFLIVKTIGKHVRKKVGTTNIEFDDLEEDVYQVIVKIKNKNIFKNDEYCPYPIYEGVLYVGEPEKFRFKNKKIKLLRANCFGEEPNWISFYTDYFIDQIKYVKENEQIYYCGRLCEKDRNGNIKVLNKMINEKKGYDDINPVRIEIRDNTSLWLVAGYVGENDFHGTLFCDKTLKSICNIQKQDFYYGEINIYKFKEEEYV